jgi:hypothetical protein
LAKPLDLVPLRIGHHRFFFVHGNSFIQPGQFVIDAPMPAKLHFAATNPLSDDRRRPRRLISSPGRCRNVRSNVSEALNLVTQLDLTQTPTERCPHPTPDQIAISAMGGANTAMAIFLNIAACPVKKRPQPTRLVLNKIVS